MNRLLTSALGILVIAGALYRPATNNLGSMPLGKSGASSRTGDTSSSVKAIALPGIPGSIGTGGSTHPSLSVTGNSNPCSETSDPLSTITGFYGLDFTDSANLVRESAGTLSAQLEGVRKDYEFRYLTVTLPDPVHTDLELFFDRSIDAISRAAAEIGFNFDRYWIPWPSAPLPLQPDCHWSSLQSLAANDQMKLPGILLFRKPAIVGRKPQLLLVFLVAETPTSGVNEAQFLNAISYIQILSATSAQLPKKGNQKVPGKDKATHGGPVEPKVDANIIDVLGPTFSGSVDSLIRAVKEANSPKPRLKFRIASGSATNSPALQRLHDQLCLKDDSNTSFKMGTTLSDDDFALRSFIAFLGTHGHVGGEIAIISEDGTEYGDIKLNETRDSDALIYLHFPRKMARLRDAYQANPQSNAAGASGNEALPHRLLPLIFNENPLSGEDNVPAFSKEHTPIAQEAEVLAMATVLRERKVKYAGILATDPLDTMFLIRFLHQVAPDVRPFVLDADLLFLRALDDDTAPVGLMAVTSYPLLPTAQEWLSHPSEVDHPLVFTSRYAEATYNACLLLLRRNPPAEDDPIKYLRDATLTSANPRVSCLSPELSLDPPLWLMVVGHNGYWPVQFLSSESKGLVSLKLEKLPRVWLFVWGTITFFAAFHALAVLYAPFSRLRWLENFRITGGQRPRRAAYLLVGTLALIFVEFLLLLAPRDSSVSQPEVLRITAAFVLAFLATTAIRLIMVARIPGVAHLETRLDILSKSLKLSSSDFSNTVMAGLLAVLFYLGRPWQLGMGNTDQYGSFLWYRSIHLTSGASPVVPFCLLMAAVYLWAWTQLACLTAAERQPSLWRSTFLWPFFQAGKKLGMNMHALIYDKWRATLVFSLMMLMFFVTFLRFNYFSTVDGRRFDYIYGPILAGLFCLIIYNLVKLLVIWSDFKKVLEGFDQLPLRSAFRRLPSYYSWSPIWEHGGTRQSYEVLIRWFNNLQKLASSTRDPELQRKYKENWRVIKRVSRWSTGRTTDSRSDSSVLAAKLGNSIIQIQDLMLKCTRYVEWKYLRSEWERGASDSLEKERLASTTPESKDKEFDVQKLRILAEESVALYYLRYIRGVCLYMRHIIFFVSAGFILAVISLKSYPFQSPRLFSLWLTLVFAVLGIGIIKVFIEMEKDAVLSCLSNTEAGKLSADFFLRLIAYGALPVFTFIAAQFPSVARFFFSWVQPGLQALK